jgi:hypothetical protein
MTWRLCRFASVLKEKNAMARYRRGMSIFPRDGMPAIGVLARANRQSR